MAKTTHHDEIPLGPPTHIGIGVVAPHDMALDAELWRWAPPAASLFFARTPFDPLPVTLEMVESLGDETGIRSTVQQLMTIAPSVYAYACTSGSFANGRAGERAVAAALMSAGGAPAVTASGAIVSALGHLGVNRVAIATPYDAEITIRLQDFLIESSVAVTGIAHLGMDANMWTVPYRRTAELIRLADSPDAQAIVVSCTNLPTYDLIAPLERELGKPIISANQATMWAALALCDLPAVGPGQRLLARPRPTERDQ
ncbi:Asp/Glu/hydantoin racemase [Cryobacterium sp. MLB-32]|uniref:maleate cis-trans isomerase family protein n=1 Tax=Cryobacterium sp. MLB-32 TaxID=1529318 RepID=UPI000A70B815|nr:Asp/Glu/hydantoin racemase [Cryobacterium sp. MLB-32]